MPPEIATPTQETTPVTTEVIPEAATEESAAPPETSAEQAETPALEEETPFGIIGDSKFKDVYDLVEHPEVKTFLDREVRRSEEKYAQASEQRIAEATRNWEATQLSRSFAGQMGIVLEKLDDNDVQGFERALSKVESMMEGYKPELQQSLKAEGATTAANIFFKEILDRAPDRRSRDDLEDFGISEFRKSGQEAWGSMLDRLMKAHGDSREDSGYKRGLKEGAERAAETSKVQNRENGAGPDTTQAKSSSNQTLEQELLDPNTPVQRLIEIRQQQRAGG